MPLAHAFARNFLGHAPDWYKLTILAFLVLNPLVMFFGGVNGPVIAGWLLLLEFIFTLAMALRCYPLQPGGLLAIEGVLIGLTTPASVYNETLAAVPVILWAVVMVLGAGDAAAQSGSASSAVSFEYVTVDRGDSLWGIAESIAPDADPRVIIDEIIRLNGLDGAIVEPGQRLALPVLP